MELIINKFRMDKNIYIGSNSYKILFVINDQTDRLTEHWKVNLIITKKLKSNKSRIIIRSKRLWSKVL